MSKKVYLFDFDGTITSADTLLHFIRFACGTWRFLLGFFLHSPMIIAMKLKLCDNGMTKQKVFSWFFRGMSIDVFDNLCKRFATENFNLMRPKATDLLNRLFRDGEDIVIVSASLVNWVSPFFTHIQRDSKSNFHVLGTIPEVKDGVITGRFLTYNCYGAEKVHCIRRLYPDRENYHFIAFGDSNGDKQMLAFADESYYRIF